MQFLCSASSLPTNIFEYQSVNTQRMGDNQVSIDAGVENNNRISPLQHYNCFTLFKQQENTVHFLKWPDQMQDLRPYLLKVDTLSENHDLKWKDA